MSYRHNGRLYDDMGVLEVTETDPGSGIRHNGWALDAAGYSHIVFERETLSGIARHDGQLFHAGRLVVTAATPGQVGDYRHKGLRYNARGSLYVTSGTPDASDPIRDGWRRTKMGAAYINGPSFFADLRDLGDGEVDTTLVVGTGSATFTRATEATCRLSNGLLKKVASGVPRSHYLSDGTFAGFLAEGAGTNLVLSSEDMRSAGAGNPVTAWTNTAVTVETATADTTAPDGTSTASKATSTGSAGLFQDAVVAATVASFSVFAKKGSGATQANRFGIRNTTTATDLLFVTINYDTLSITYNTGSAGCAIEEWGGGWIRITLSVGSGITSGDTIRGYAGFVGAATSGQIAYLWGAQLEAAAFASSYIPTTTAAVTRNEDVLTYGSSGNVIVTAGTLYAEITRMTTVPTVAYHLAVNDGSENNRVVAFGGSGNEAYRVTNGGVSSVSASGSATLSANTPYKLAMSWAANDFAAYINGAADLTDSSVTVPASFTTIAIGAAVATGSAGFACFKNVRAWQRVLPNAVKAALTS